MLLKPIRFTIAGALVVTLTSAIAHAQPPPKQEPSSEEQIRAALFGGVPGDRWKEGLLFEGIRPMPWLKSAANWFPRTEEVQPNEMRIIFMGTAPFIRPGQMNTSILVQLGNGDNLIFDIGEGSVANYIASGFALNELKHVFITHLHVDHFGALPYLWMFGTWAGGWHENLNVYGPSGRTEEYGTATMVEGMRMMTNWHRDAFSVFPVGKGWDVIANEYDFRDNGGVIYDRNGAKVIHWQRSHAKDGASAYRLDWNGLCFVWTGDGRPSKLDEKYAKGCDVYVTEMQPELIEISSGVQGVPPFLGRYTIDTHHTPGYAAGYLASKVQPRIFMTTHMPFDPYLNEEAVAEIRHHWTGPSTSERPTASWSTSPRRASGCVRGSFPTTRTARAPQFDFTNGQLIVPHPPTSRAEIQEPFVREQQIDPKEYYPEGYHPELLEEWPVEGDLVIPLEALPETLRQSMGAEWRLRNKNRKVLEEQAAQGGEPEDDEPES